MITDRINNSYQHLIAMSLNLKNKDLEDFSNFLGFEGIDSDLFYETYYQLDSDSLELEESWREVEGA